MNELNLNDNNLTTPKDIAEGFNDYFSNIGPELATEIESSTSISKCMPLMPNQSLLAFKPFIVSHVYRLLLGLSSNKATGIDKISCKIIKLAAPVISDSLTLIFNQCMTLFCFPDEWKTAKVVPLYKNGIINCTAI